MAKTKAQQRAEREGGTIADYQKYGDEYVMKMSDDRLQKLDADGVLESFSQIKLIAALRSREPPLNQAGTKAEMLARVRQHLAGDENAKRGIGSNANKSAWNKQRMADGTHHLAVENAAMQGDKGTKLYQLTHGVLSNQGVLVDPETGRVAFRRTPNGHAASFMTTAALELGITKCDTCSAASILKKRMIYDWNFVLDERCMDRDGNRGNGRQYGKAYTMVNNDVPWDYMAHLFYHPDLKKGLPELRQGALRQLSEKEKKACLPKLS